jgi:hypothetical protein
MRNDGINLNEKDINLLMSLQYLPDDSPFANMQIRVKNRNGYKEIWTLDTVETAIFECLIGFRRSLAAGIKSRDGESLAERESLIKNFLRKYDNDKYRFFDWNGWEDVKVNGVTKQDALKSMPPAWRRSAEAGLAATSKPINKN